MSKFDVDSFLKERREKERLKKNNTKTNDSRRTFDADKFLHERTIGFDTFSDDLNAMNTTLSGIYSNWQDADTMAKTRESVSSFYDRLSAYENYRKTYGTEEDELPDLSELAGMYKSSLEGWDDLANVYGGYSNAEAYNKAVEGMQKAEDKKTAAIASKKEAEEKKTSYVASDYVPNSSFGMTKAEYNRRRQANPDMPEFGSYDYFVEREKALKPMVDEIAKDADRNDPTFRAWADNYAKDNTWGEGKPVHQQAKSLYEKFNRQDAILAEYNAIHEQLTKFESKGVHYTDSLEVDTESGAKEAQYAQDRLDTLLFATPLTNEEAVLGFYGELPEDKQANYDHIRDIAGQSAMEASKESAYKYYEKNKDKEYNDNFVGRVFGNAKIGRIGIKSNSAGYASYSASSDDIEASEVYQLLSERIQSRNAETFQNNNGFDKTVATVSQYIPQGIDQFVYGTVGKLAGNVVGSATASSMYMYEQTAGASFVRLLQETDLSVEDAKALARSESLASSAVEFGLGLATGGLWNGGVNLTKGATSELGERFIKTLTSAGISERGARIILNTATTAGKLTFEGVSEGLEEGWQEGIAITTDKYAEKGQTASAPGLLFKALDYSQYSPEERAQIKEAAMSGATIGNFMGVGNAAVSSVQSHLDPNRKLGQTIRNNDNIDKILDMASTPFSPEEASAYEAYKEYAENGMTASNAYDREVGELASNLQRDLVSVIKSDNTSADQKAQAMKKLRDLDAYTQNTSASRFGEGRVKELYGDKEKVQTLIDNALKKGEGTKAHKLATEYKAKIESGKELSEKELTKLVDVTTSGIKDTVKVDAEQKLRELGETENAVELSKIISKAATGQMLSSAETEAIANNENARKVFAQMDKSSNIELMEASEAYEGGDAELFLENYEGGDIDKYRASFDFVSSLAKNNYDADFILEHRGELTPRQVQNIYSKVVAEPRAEQQRKLDELVKNHEGQLVRKANIDDSIFNGAKGQKLWRNLNSRQKKAITFVKAFAKGAGINLKITYDGKYKGKAYNGYYDNATNTIVIDARAGFDRRYISEDAIIPTMSHELTHWMKQKSPELYAKLSKQIFDVFKAKGYTEYDLIATEKQKHPDMSDEDARDEIIARASEDLFKMSEEGKKIFDSLSEAEKKTLVGKIKELIQNLVDWANELLGLYESKSDEAGWLREFKDELSEIAKTWDQMLAKAVEVNAALEGEGVFGKLENGISEDGTTIVGEGVLQMSEKTYYDGGREYLVKWLSRQKGLTKEDKADIVAQTDKVAEIMRAVAEGNELPDYSRWANLEVVKDEKGEKVLSVIVKNGDYTMNIDFSQVCKKRVALNAVLNAMVQAGDLNVHVLTETDVADLNAIIKKHDFEIACALCFVDSKRYRVGAWAESFCEGTDTDDGTHKYGFNEMVRSLVPKGSKLNIDEFNFTKRDIKNQPTKNLLSEASDSELDFSLIDKIMSENDVRSAQHRYARAIKENPQIRKILNSAEIISSIGLDAIRLEAPALYNIINGHQGTAKPKFSHDAVAYGNDVLKARGFTAKRAKMVGGVRCQSFSDFMANMVVDYAQFISELAAKRLTSHAYTKEPLFVKLFGLTGMKINMSLVPKAVDMTAEQQKQFAILKGKNADKNSEEYKAALEEYEKLAENAGLDENGNYIWEDETFPYDIAMEIVDDPRYSANCGTIAVGISKAHILKLLADDKISMVIPYHKSGLNRDVAMMRDIALYHDYTSVQNTRYANDEAMYGDDAGKKLNKDKGDRDFDFYGDLYGVGKKEGTHDPKKTAQNYLDWCDKHNYTPRFDEFRDHPNYYKLLIDFRVYDTDGTYREQQAVKAIYPEEAEFKDLILNGVKDKDGKVYGGLIQSQENSDRLKAETKQIVDEYREVLAEKYGQDVLGVQLSEKDTEYLELAKNSKKNEAKLRRIADEAAIEWGCDVDENGKPVKFYHGTDNFGFTQLDVSVSDDGISFFATDSLEVARTYVGNKTKTDADVRRIGKKGDENTTELRNAEIKEHEKTLKKLLVDRDDMIKFINKKLRLKTTEDLYDISGIVAEAIDRIENGMSYNEAFFGDGDFVFTKKPWSTFDDAFDAFAVRYAKRKHRRTIPIEEYRDTEEYNDLYGEWLFYEGKLSSALSQLGAITENKGIYAMYGKTGDFLEIDAGGSEWNDILVPGAKELSTREVAELAKEQGYAGVKISNLIDDGGRGKKRQTKPATVYIFFNPSEQMKSADTVTYDDDGNVIPISQRFTEKDDIRFSEKDTEGNTLSKGQVEFFENSVVRDKDGRLLAVYHGTPHKNVNNFSYDFVGSVGGANHGYGFYFTDSEKDAALYAQGNGEIKKAYINITSPIYSTSKDLTNKIDELFSRLPMYAKNSLKDEYGNIDDAKHYFEEYIGKHGNGVFLSVFPDKAGIHPEVFNKILGNMGYDGVIYKEEGYSTEYVVFESNQAKLTTNKNPTFNPDIRFSEKDTGTSAYDIMGEKKALEKRYNKLAADFANYKERVKLDKTLTKGKVIEPKQLEAVARYLVKYADSDYKASELAKMLNDLYVDIQDGAMDDSMSWDEMYSKAYEIAKEIRSEARIKIERPALYDKILKDIRSARIAPNDGQKGDAKHRFGDHYIGKFRGRVTIANDGTPLDIKWSEWAAEYPSVFDKDIGDAQQLVELYDIYDDLRNAGDVVQEYEESEVLQSLATEIINKAWTVTKFESTADKQNKRIQELNAEHRKAMEELKDTYTKKVSDAKLLEQMYYGKLLNQVQTKRKQEVSEAKAAGRERLAKYRENAERRVRIQRITNNSLTLNKWLVKNSKEEHIHEALKTPVINLLNAIDFSSKRMIDKGIPTNKDISLAKALTKVKDMMVKASNGHADFVQLYGHGLDEKIEKMMESIDAMDRTIADNEFILQKMSLEDLDTLDKVVRTIKAAVSKLNKFHVANHKEGIASLSRISVRDMDSLGKGKINSGMRGKIDKTLMWNNTLPAYAFERFGEGGKIIFGAIQDGWDKFAFNVKKALDYAEEAYTSKEVTEWEKDVKTFKILVPVTEADLADPDYEPEYQKVQMTIPQIMSLYCMAKREQAKGHILGGGIRVADFTIKKKLGEEVITQEEGAVLTAKDIESIVGTLTSRQKTVADKLQEFMNTVCTEWGNEVSMARFGYKAFGEENYFPIKSDDNNLSNDPTDAETSLFRLLNMSFTKSLTEGANNRVIISDIFDVFAQHASDMAKYNSLALPVLDAFTWYNYTEKQDVGDEGQFKTQGVKQAMEKAFGKDGQSYFTTFLKDINGQKEVSRDTVGNSFFTNAKIAAVGANLRVVALQPTSYVRASAVIDNKYLAKAFAHKPKIEKAEKYCGIALWKSMGYYDTNIQRGVTEQIKHKETWKDKATEASMKGAEWADKLTWGYLWNACELEIRDTRKDLTVGSEEFYDAIAKRLREVIYKTQVVDSTMTRSQLMRSGQFYDKMLTSFASEPTLAYNMLIESFNQASLDTRKMGRAASWKKNGKHIARTIAAYTMTNALAALVESAFDAYRDDDDEEKDLAYFMKLYFSNFGQDMSITGKIPYIKELHSMFKGFSASRTDTQWMESLTKSLTEWGKIATTDKGNPVKAVKETLRTFSYITGLPFYNAYRDAMAGLDKVGILTTEDLEEILEDIFG